MSIFFNLFSLPVVPKPTQRLSGDQNGMDPLSVPGSGWADGESRERTHNWTGSLPLLPRAPKTMRLPSGDIAGSEYWLWKSNTAFSGGSRLALRSVASTGPRQGAQIAS